MTQEHGTNGKKDQKSEKGKQFQATENERGLLQVGNKQIEWPRRDHPEHRDGQESAADFDKEMRGYAGIRDLMPIESITRGVRCPIPGYEHLIVHYRTSVSSKRRRERPALTLSPELQQLQARQHATAQEDPEWLPLTVELTERLGEERERFNREHYCPWLASFVAYIEGWNYGRTIDYTAEGTRVMEPIPSPRANDPSSFYIVCDEMEDFLPWLADTGYDEALKEAVGKDFTQAS